MALLEVGETFLMPNRECRWAGAEDDGSDQGTDVFIWKLSSNALAVDRTTK